MPTLPSRWPAFTGWPRFTSTLPRAMWQYWVSTPPPWRITTPLIVANLIAGAMLAFAFSMLEVSDSLMLAQRADKFPITKTIYELFQLIGTGKYLACALGLWAMLFLATTIIGASAILGKKMGAIFRV